MSLKTGFIIIADILIAFFLAKLIFRSFKNFRRGVYYLLCPDILSIIKKVYDKDFSYTHKFLLLMGGIIYSSVNEINVFY